MSLVELYIQSSLLFSSCINLLPTLGVLGSQKLEQLYGVSITEVNQELMMRHRALLFGIVGGILGLAVVHKPSRKIAYASGLTSMASYMLLATASSAKGLQGFTSQIQRVFWIDFVGVAWLGSAAILDLAVNPKDKNE